VTQELKDPNKPAGFVVKINDDGTALTNDGRTLQPAEKNLWYVLATVFGDHADGYDRDIHEKNRRIWNGWACGGLGPEECKDLSIKSGIPVEELQPLDVSEIEMLNAAFKKRLGNDAEVPDPEDDIDFSATHLRNPFRFPKYVFTRHANFDSASFTGYADFESATFTRHANFESATFTGFTTFRSATFTRHANFESATFTGITDFQDGKFLAATDFTDAEFTTASPRFHNCDMHQDTEFTLETSNWPDATEKNAVREKSAHTRLRQIMVELHKPDDTHFFHRMEMRAKAHIGPWYEKWITRAYGVISDYGCSMMRPVFGLTVLWFSGWVYYGASFICHCQSGVQGKGDGLLAAGLSVSNMFAFLG
jgi:hypothetical protein